tara:strand:- start:11 stop:1756 length:1746 start_codon:yes stop_codon:yes gene_type:complete
MGLVIADRVKETTTTTGTGTINLAGADTGFQTFVAGIGSGNTCYYTITSGNDWEVGLGTVTDASPDTLSRTTILSSSNSDSAINLSGTSTVFCTYPALKSVHLDASGNLSHTVDISSDTNLVGGTNITLSGDTLNVDDAFLVNDASDTTTGTITAGGFTTTGTWTFDESTSGTVGITTVQKSSSSFSDNDTSLMTSAAILDKIQATGGSVSDINDLGDVSFGGTNLTKTLLINNAPGSAPTTGILGSDCSYNLAIGDTALNSITDATYNVALGSNALTALTTGDHNIGIGYNAGAVTTTGHKNVMVGFEAGKNVASSSGESNVALGTSALTGHASSFTGSYNFAVGYSSMEDTTTGSYNIAFGYEALKTITEGDKNIAIGFQVGNNHTTSDSMLYIGNAQPSSDGTLIKGDMANKFLAVGKADVTLSTEDATLQVYPLNTNDSAYFAKMPGSHTGDLIRIENSSGTALFKVDKDGDLTTNSITISESPVVPYTAITGDTTVTTSNVVVFANATSGAIDVTMYTADSNGGRTLTVKKTDSSTNAVSILRAGSDTIDGATSVILYNQNESVTLISDNSNWFII